jgi:hypothetical protein
MSLLLVEQQVDPVDAAPPDGLELVDIPVLSNGNGNGNVVS